ncbi:hypothetical protein L7F22_056853 [Adiantum nelumboides]|nr:hypothetical protein [Adiantum nelumboides]
MEAACSSSCTRPGLCCSICLCDAIKDPVVTCCGHLFCWACVYRWASIHRTCPLCKGFLTRNDDFTPIFITCCTQSSTAAAVDVECPNSSAVDAALPPRPPARRNYKEPDLHELAAPLNQQQLDAQNSTAAHDDYLGFLYPREADDRILTINRQYDAYAAQSGFLFPREADDRRLTIAQQCDAYAAQLGFLFYPREADADIPLLQDQLFEFSDDDHQLLASAGMRDALAAASRTHGGGIDSHIRPDNILIDRQYIRPVNRRWQHNIAPSIAAAEVRDLFERVAL